VDLPNFIPRKQKDKGRKKDKNKRLEPKVKMSCQQTNGTYATLMFQKKFLGLA
jgi:hypothetical protein